MGFFKKKKLYAEILSLSPRQIESMHSRVHTGLLEIVSKSMIGMKYEINFSKNDKEYWLILSKECEYANPFLSHQIRLFKK